MQFFNSLILKNTQRIDGKTSRGEKVQRAIGRAESRLRLCSGLGLSIDVDGRVDASPTLPFKLLLSLLESATLFESVL